MLTFPVLLRRNRNYRWMWISQVVSEIGDHFNTIAVLSLVLENTRSGAVVSGVMLARGVAMITAGPVAGVILDRLDRQHVLIASTVARAAVAGCFVFTVDREDLTLIYALSGLLMFVSPFFNSGRTAILPVIASPEELHTANALTQTTRYATVTVGMMLGGLSTAALGYEAAFLLNAASLLFSAWMISWLRLTKGSFRAERKALTEADVARPWHDYKEGLRYIKSVPLMLAICLIHVGWATGGGAAQILFSLFGEIVFERGAAGIGMIWGFGGVGLVIGGSLAHRIGPKLGFENYKKLLIVAFAIHGSSYILFSQAPYFWVALIFIVVSRAAWGVATVLNLNQLLIHVPDSFRGRVFSTIESLTWGTMMLSLAVAGFASDTYGPRVIGAWAGALSSLTAVGWGWAHWRGALVEPAVEGIDADDLEVDRLPRV